MRIRISEYTAVKKTQCIQLQHCNIAKKSKQQNTGNQMDKTKKEEFSVYKKHLKEFNKSITDTCCNLFVSLRCN